MNNLKSKLNELEKVREELHEVISKRGTMLGLSHRDPGWNATKAENWGNDADRLQAKEQSILEEICQLKHSAEFIQELETKKQAIYTKRSKLQAEYAKLKVEVFEKRGVRAQAVIDGADPIKVASELFSQQDRMEVIAIAIENLNIASSILDKLAEDMPFTPAHAQDLPKGQKFDVPSDDQLRIAQAR